MKVSVVILNDNFVLYREMNLTKSQLVILDILRANREKGTTPKEIHDKVSYAPRTVRNALRKLLHQNLICRVPCLQDMRQAIYFPK
ncbi:MAG: MarR family transcriptional regulator [Candidatus Thorarchaeota archaeon]|jgi:DNA-binding MarR family transcriptional regulator